jgi:phenylacetate-CoA ligase
LPACHFTTKAELVADQADHPPWGSTLTEPVRLHTALPTSSTTGQRSRLDTNDSWPVLDCWKAVYRGARVGAAMASSSRFPSVVSRLLDRVRSGERYRGAGDFWRWHVEEQRLAMIETTRPTVICCTPTYALRLAGSRRATAGADLRSDVRVLIVAGGRAASPPPADGSNTCGMRASSIITD